MIGRTIGPYQILAELGRGGMGEVYRAKDTKLNRDVAIKVLPESFALDADRVARFTREAQVLASLNHPNIAAIYGIEEQGSTRALVMELVEGRDLSELIGALETQGALRTDVARPGSQGRERAQGLPLSDALPIAKQIADALEAAHEQGIVHRDLKPQNIKVRTDGTVKVLDFGLAKAMDRTLDSGPGTLDRVNSPTMTARATQMGMILGTAAYMSPEQARGKAVDRRADIWAFGVVLYEMLSGRRAFEGEDISITLANVLKEDVRWDALPTDLPATLQKLLRRCLEKDPKRRLGWIGEARLILEDGATLEPTAHPLVSKRAAVLWVAAWVVFVAAAFVIGRWTSGNAATADEKPVWSELLPPEKPFGNRPLSLALSPDGRALVLTAPDATGETVLWIRSFDTGASRALPQTAGATLVCWAPNGHSLAFMADGKLKTVGVDGGTPQVLAEAPFAEGIAWSADGTIFFVPTGTNVQSVPASGGGTPIDVTHLDPRRGETVHGFPSLLPDQKHFLIWLFSSDKKNEGVYVVSPAGDMRMILPFRTRAVYANGFLFFGRPPFLMAQRFDPIKLELSGDAIRVAEGLAWDNIELSNMQFSVSDDGTRGTDATIVWSNHSPIGRAQPTWLDRAGHVLGTIGEPGQYIGLAPSPDGKHTATEVVDINALTTDVVLLDAVGGNATRLTTANYWAGNPVWSSDSRRVLFTQWQDRLFIKPTTSGESEQVPFAGGSNSDFPQSWSEDGQHLLVVRNDRSNQGDLWDLPLSGDRTPKPYLNSPLNEFAGQFSPDGHWVAYTSNEFGHNDVFVQSFPVPGNKHRVSANGGAEPMWRHDGQELYFVNNDAMMAASVSFASGSPVFSTPVLLFRSNYIVDLNDQRPAFAPDLEGKRFLVLLPVKSDRPEGIHVIHHWKR